jgi:AcrR family transcriptional regulator
MNTRAAASEETRLRIVDATVQLHNEQGISGTSMQDIADRAEVALATVYRHFPTVDDLVPACGGRNLELNPPPTPAVFEDFESGEERVSALVAALHANYARGMRTYEVGFAEAVTMPVVARFMDEFSAYVGELVATAAAPYEAGETQLKLAAGLCNFRVWRALLHSGLTSNEVDKAVTRLICHSLSERTSTKRGRA